MSLNESSLPSPDELTNRFNQLEGKRAELLKQLNTSRDELKEIDEWLAIEPDVKVALETLSNELFRQITSLLETNLTTALQEILEQPLELKVVPDYKNNSATISFHAERDGNEENILKGMGGSVANILSVGLRIFALTTLDQKEHRRFLVLDEQDCWIRPDIVPRLVKIIHEACQTLGFQILMISHHDASIFEKYADRIIRLEHQGTELRARILNPEPNEAD